jgi:hypothetical protein
VFTLQRPSALACHVVEVSQRVPRPALDIPRKTRLLEQDADGQEGVVMQRMQGVNWKLTLVPVVVLTAGIGGPARGDLIRPKTPRSYPDIAGDIIGTQTYTFDPTSKTGTFLVRNSPQFIALGPTGGDLVSMSPNQDGTLSETLQLTLDQNGKLIPGTNNRFQLYGTVVIGNQTYQGLLLEGTPTAFGAQVQKGGSLNPSDVFDLNMTITGGQLASAFGPQAYFRVIPQSNSTFQGSFATSFSGDRPLTNLRAIQGHLPTPIPEPSPLAILMAAGAGLALKRLWNRGRESRRARRGSINLK